MTNLNNNVNAAAITDDAIIAAKLSKLPKPKEMKLSCDHINVDPLNPRLDATNNVIGVDTTNTVELEERIKADGGIRRKLAIFKDEKGLLWAMQGGRRLRSAKRIKADGNAPANVVKEMDNILCDVYEGLTVEQRLFIINDQDQKKFRFTDIVNLIFIRLEAGLTWQETAAELYRQYGETVGGSATDILNDIDRLAGDRVAWKKRIETWLKGAFKEVYATAFHIGAGLPKIILTQAAEKDKLIITKANAPKGTPAEKMVAGPLCYLMGNQKRLDELEKAKAADMVTGKWDAFDGGPEFAATLEKFRKEDYDGEKTVQVKSLSREKLQEVAKTAKSKLGDKLLKMAAGDKDVEWKGEDLAMALVEAKSLKFLQAGEFKNPDVKTALHMAFNCDDFEQFKAWLKTQVVPVVEPDAAA